MKPRFLKLTLASTFIAGALLAAPAVPAAPPYQATVYAQANPSAEAAEPPGEPVPDIAADVSVSVNGKRVTHREAVVKLGGDAHLRTNESAEAVVVIGGNGRVDGTVKDVFVVVGGDATVQGEVRGVVVAVGGSVRLLEGAKVGGDVISVGGQVDSGPDATIGGSVQQVSIGPWMPDLKWLRDWLVECVFKLRPLSFKVGWVWLVALALFFVYLLTALALRRAVAACVRQIEERPATTFLAGLLGKLLAPLVLGLFVATGIGLLGVPFLLAAMAVAVLIGKVALFEYLGLQLGKVSGNAALQQPLVAFVVGWAILTLLCVVPILGLLLMMVTALWGFGAAVMALFARSRQERPPVPPAASFPAYPAYAPAAAAMPVAAPFAAPVGFGGEPPLGSFAGGGGPAAVPVLPGVPPVQPAAPPEAMVFPRASFWQRMAAGFLDIILVGVVSGILNVAFGFLLVGVAYFGGLWAWKQTTIGGIIVGLKVVRLDGRPLDWTVALVRALAAWLSTSVMFLGFFWIAWDADRQGWHDRIAGTVVVKLPRGTPLVVL
jgi:uncharacterized RDD family membrane protein YckC